MHEVRRPSQHRRPALRSNSSIEKIAHPSKAKEALRTAAWCCVDTLERRVLMAAAPSAAASDFALGGRKSAHFTDADGSDVKVSLSGPGAGTLTRGSDGNIESIQLAGTTGKTLLKVRTSGGTDEGSIVQNLTVTPAASVQGDDIGFAGLKVKTDSFKFALSFPGNLNRVEFKDVGAEHVINIGDGAGVNDTVSVWLGHISDLQITSATPINLLSAWDWADTNGDDFVSAPWIDSIFDRGGLQADLNLSGANAVGEAIGFFNVKSVGSMDINATGGGVREMRVNTWGSGAINADWVGSIRSAGDFGADVTTTDANQTLRKLIVGGSLKNATIHAAGNIGEIDADTIEGSAISAGMSGDLTALPDSNTGLGAAAISKLTAGTFADSKAAAKAIGSAKLNSVSVANSVDAFGFAAEVIKLYNRGNVQLTNLSTPGESDKNGNYVVRIVGAGEPNPNPDVTLAAALSTDSGASASDGITKQAAVTGTLTGTATVASFAAAFDSAPAGAFVNILTDLGAGGAFTLTAARLAEINGAALTDGPHTLHLVAKDATDTLLASKDVVFTLDTLAPTVTNKTPDGTEVPTGTANVDVTFSEAVADPKATDLSLSGAGAAGATVGTPTKQSGDVWRFPVSGLVAGAVTATLGPVNDLAGNASTSSTWNFTVNGAPSTFVDPVFDVAALTATPLNAQTTKTTEANGIVTEEVMFHSETFNGTSVDIFGLLVYPKGGKNLPTFIWNQGGLAQADTNIITDEGAKRGYAALCIDFPMPGYRSTGGYNIVGGLNQTPNAFDADISRGVVALLKAVSYLQTRPEVNPDKIGMAGSSWGGFYTTLMAGVDPRLAAAAAMFGTGELQTGNLWWDTGGRSSQFDATAREQWRTTLDPALRLTKRDTPVAWFSGTDDQFYWMPALSATYSEAIGPKHLTLTPNYNHALDGALFDEVFAFLDQHLKGSQALIETSPLTITKANGKLTATWNITDTHGRTPTSANVILSYGDAGNWPSRAWKTLPAQINGNTVTADLPNGPINYYVSGTVIDGDGFNTSTALQFVDVTALGVKDPSLKLNYDGAEPFGGFEPDQIFYIEANSYFTPTTSSDSHGGTQSVVLTTGGATTFQQLEFTEGVAHRLTLWLKSSAATNVDVQLIGDFDGVAKTEQKSAAVGTDWTQVTLDFDPPPALSATIHLQLTVPTGVTVKMDDLSFRPIE